MNLDRGENTQYTADGLALYYQWQRVADARGVILIVHGIGEHIGRYRALEDWFCGQGFSCHGYDQRGHGRSAGRRTHVGDFSEYLDDLRLITELVRAREPSLPLFFYAHSMGAVVALLHVLRSPVGYRGLIVASPALEMGVSIPGWLVKAGHVIAWLTPTLKVPSLISPASLTHDPQVIADYENDPLVQGTVTLGWLANMLSAQKQILTTAAGIALPLLVLHSRADVVANIAGTHRLVEQLSANQVTVHEYIRPFHELHNEIAEDRSAMLNDVLNWLNQQIEN